MRKHLILIFSAPFYEDGPLFVKCPGLFITLWQLARRFRFECVNM